MEHPNFDRIRDLAHSMWRAEGSPEGRDKEFWELAERKLSEERKVDTHQLAAHDDTPPAAVIH